jgi:DNA-binding XRE family transcriptional regulator
MTIQTTIVLGEEFVTMTRDEYQALVDARDHEAAMRKVAAGLMPTVADAELDDYLAAPTPLAFWRKRSGMTQSALGSSIGVSQPYIAQLESGRRVAADIRIYNRIAKCLGVRIEDLIPDD